MSAEKIKSIWGGPQFQLSTIMDGSSSRLKGEVVSGLLLAHISKVNICDNMYKDLTDSVP